MLSSSVPLFISIRLHHFISAPTAVFTDPSSVILWVFIILVLVRGVAGNIRTIAALVTLLISEAERDKANGLVGTVNGVAFLVASISSGLAIGFLGVYWMLMFAIGLTFSILHLG